jgi:hypothetical protein
VVGRESELPRGRRQMPVVARGQMAHELLRPNREPAREADPDAVGRVVGKEIYG